MTSPTIGKTGWSSIGGCGILLSSWTWIPSSDGTSAEVGDDGGEDCSFFSGWSNGCSSWVSVSFGFLWCFLWVWPFFFLEDISKPQDVTDMQGIGAYYRYNGQCFDWSGLARQKRESGGFGDRVKSSVELLFLFHFARGKLLWKGNFFSFGQKKVYWFWRIAVVLQGDRTGSKRSRSHHQGNSYWHHYHHSAINSYGFQRILVEKSPTHVLHTLVVESRAKFGDMSCVSQIIPYIRAK